MNNPTITVIKDYDGAFKRRVEQAIALNTVNQVEMVAEISINAGPYRSHCLAWSKSADKVELDFYAANRVFGFEHTIEDLAGVIAKA